MRAHYAEGTIEDTICAYREAFGITRSEGALRTMAFNLGLGKGLHIRSAPPVTVRKVFWSREPEKQAWMDEHDRGQCTAQLSEAFADKFGFPLSRTQITQWRSANGRQVKPSTASNYEHPVGTVREMKGYLVVKVEEQPSVPGSKDNWHFVHVLEWEKANGRKLPEGHVVMFADGDHRNFDPDNLVAVSRRLMCPLNNPSTPSWHDRESLESAIAFVKLGMKMREVEFAAPRTCEVCGKTFQLAEKHRDYSSFPRTCPECLAEHKRPRGDRHARSGPLVARCAVCGREFVREASNQRRCKDCIAEKPTFSIEAQRKQRGLDR